MFITSEFQQINRKLKELQNERSAKLKKTWGIVLGVTIFVIAMLIIIFPHQFDDPGVGLVLPVFGGMILLVELAGFLISIKYMSEKPFFEYLYPEIYKKINMEEGLTINYKAYDKEDKDFFKSGGLVTRLASVRVRRHVRSKTDQETPFDIYDCIMLTSSGKSQQVHFDGVYFRLHKTMNTSIQIRTSGFPSLKGTKFSRHKEFEDIKVYKEKDETVNELDKVVIDFIRKLRKQNDYKAIFFSVVKGQIHLGLWFRKHPARKQKTMSVKKLNDLRSYFLSEGDLVKEIENLDNY